MRLLYSSLLALSLCLFSSVLQGQQPRTIYACGYDENHIADEMCNHFQANGLGYSDYNRRSTQAEQLVASILDPIGLPQKFIVSECKDIQNAMAITHEGNRYIIFDPDFVAGYLKDAGDGLWMKKAILAHEIGHHLCGHTLRGTKSLAQKRNLELEADEFAGFMLFKLGASEREALLAVNRYGRSGDDSGSTHPNKEKRKTAVLSGYSRAKGQTVSNAPSIPSSASKPNLTISFDNGIDLYNRGDYDRASDVFYELWKQSKNTGSEDFSALFNSALSADNAGKYVTAAQSYEYLADKFTSFDDQQKIDYADCPVFASAAYQQAGLMRQAKEVLQNARYNQPASTSILIELLNLHILAQEDNYILQIASAILDIDPTNEEVIFAAAFSLDNIGRIDQSRELYEILLNLNNRNYDALFNLGSSYFNEAVEFVNRANDLWSANMSSELAAQQQRLESMGARSFSAALEYLEQAYSINPYDADLYRPMMDAYYRTGQDIRGDEFSRKLND